ncbi:MAG: hypothetical protein EOP04_02825 [Proteobacteria bacterium]|nr:MAG: hypothetical protein EOP04_02825 [Pseudomonadota bacterium]
MSRPSLSDDQKKQKIVCYVDAAVYKEADDHGNRSEWLAEAGRFYLKWSPMVKREEAKFEKKMRLKIKELVLSKRKRIKKSQD